MVFIECSLKFCKFSILYILVISKVCTGLTIQELSVPHGTVMTLPQAYRKSKKNISITNYYLTRLYYFLDLQINNNNNKTIFLKKSLLLSHFYCYTK